MDQSINSGVPFHTASLMGMGGGGKVREGGREVVDDVVEEERLAAKRGLPKS